MPDDSPAVQSVSVLEEVRRGSSVRRGPRIAPLVVEYQTVIDAEVRLDGRKLYGYDRFNLSALQAFSNSGGPFC